jgi:hypothetical protein
MQPFTFFVSYRRQDTAPIALLLKNEIEKRLQFVRVSVDVDEMRAGDDFPDRPNTRNPRRSRWPRGTVTGSVSVSSSPRLPTATAASGSSKCPAPFPISSNCISNTSAYEGWHVDNFGNTEVRYLVKTFEFPHFNRAADFMALVADHCRVLDHHSAMSSTTSLSH